MKFSMIITISTYFFIIIPSFFFSIQISAFFKNNYCKYSKNKFLCNDKNNVSNEITSCDNHVYPTNIIDHENFDKHNNRIFFNDRKLTFRTNFFRLYQSENLNNNFSIHIKEKLIKIAKYIKMRYNMVNVIDLARIMLNEIQVIRYNQYENPENMTLKEFSKKINDFFCLSKNSQYFLIPCILLENNYSMMDSEFFLIIGGIIRDVKKGVINNNRIFYYEESDDIEVGFADYFNF